MIDPNDAQDQHGNQYQPMRWPEGARVTAICSCCERDFLAGGWMGFAPRGREMDRIRVCPDHAMVRGLMDHEEMEVGV